MAGHSQLRDDFNRLSVEILKADVDLALTFADLAFHRADKTTKAQAVQKARVAYDAVSHRRAYVLTSREDADQLASKLGILKKRLESLGEKFENA